MRKLIIVIYKYIGYRNQEEVVIFENELISNKRGR